ncbi:MAG: M48 family metallopeptidase, partial [Deltaproteobacteria bacterium]|nr:M48 family metallopeptidase [Deltaproteobacteria bacterium]
AVINGVTSELILLGSLLGGFLFSVDARLAAWRLHDVWAGLLFFGVLGVIFYILELPFDYYHTFVIEEKYGFNRSNYRLWLTDHLKASLLSACLMSVVLVPILWAIRGFPNTWWLWGAIIVSGLQIVLMVLYPIVIAPLFNRFEPLQDDDLAEKVKNLLQGAGLRVKEIFQMDAGRRSRHTNAYFTGIGKAKRVVLFDTLIQRHPHDEILAILAHEAGHFRGRHLIKQLIVFGVSMLVIFYLTYRLMGWPLLYATFGFDGPRAHVGLLLIGIFLQKAGFFFKPLYMALTRRWERAADEYAVRLLHDFGPLARALKRLAADNLANLAPHPIYVWFNASHPPLGDRVAALEERR